MRRSVMNLYVHCKNGTSFIKSVEDCASVHTGEHIFRSIEDCIKEMGKHRVLQVVIDNVVVNMAAKNMTAMICPKLFWSNCATHTIDLIPEDIGKLSKYRLYLIRLAHLRSSFTRITQLLQYCKST